MSKFYALATTGKGTSVIIDNLPEERNQARLAAEIHCKRNGLTFQGVRPVRNTQHQGGTLQKRFADGSPTPRRKGDAHKKSKRQDDLYDWS